MYRRSLFASAIAFAMFGLPAQFHLVPNAIEHSISGGRQRRGKVRGAPRGSGTKPTKHHNRRAGRGARNKRRSCRLRGRRG